MTPWRSQGTAQETKVRPAGDAKPVDAKERRELTLAALLFVGVVALGAAMVSGDFPTPEPTSVPASAAATSTLASALARCPTADHPDESGGTLSLDGQDSAAVARLGCILGATNAPARVLDHVTSTQSQDGEQVEQWDDVEAHWIRQSDGGLTFTIEQYR